MRELAFDTRQPPPGSHRHGGGGPASKRVIVGYGFWLFLLSDIVIFACLFATYAVLADATAGGPRSRLEIGPGVDECGGGAKCRAILTCCGRDDVGLGRRTRAQPVVHVHRSDVAAGSDGKHEQRQ